MGIEIYSDRKLLMEDTDSIIIQEKWSTIKL